MRLCMHQYIKVLNTDIYAQCLGAGDDTITHHIDRALGRSLLGSKESEESTFNEQQLRESQEEDERRKTDAEERSKT